MQQGINTQLTGRNVFPDIKKMPMPEAGEPSGGEHSTNRGSPLKRPFGLLLRRASSVYLKPQIQVKEVHSLLMSGPLKTLWVKISILNLVQKQISQIVLCFLCYARRKGDNMSTMGGCGLHPIFLTKKFNYYSANQVSIFLSNK